MTDAEEKWSDFISKQLEEANKTKNPFSFKPDDLDTKILTLAFSVIVAIPLKREVKHSLDSLEQKVVMAQTNLGLKPLLQCKFNCKQSDIDETVRKLQHSIKTGNDYNKSMQILFKLFFTIFNAFVSPPTYDGADRHLMKMFLENC